MILAGYMCTSDKPQVPPSKNPAVSKHETQRRPDRNSQSSPATRVSSLAQGSAAGDSHPHSSDAQGTSSDDEESEELWGPYDYKDAAALSDSNDEYVQPDVNDPEGDEDFKEIVSKQKLEDLDPDAVDPEEDKDEDEDDVIIIEHEPDDARSDAQSARRQHSEPEATPNRVLLSPSTTLGPSEGSILADHLPSHAAAEAPRRNVSPRAQ